MIAELKDSAIRLKLSSDFIESLLLFSYAISFLWEKLDKYPKIMELFD